MNKGLFLAIIASVSLAACGGGGGGSVSPPTGGGGGKSTAVLAAGFAQTRGAAAQVRSSRRITFAMKPQATLGGSIYPFAIFFVPDSYVPQAATFTIGYQAIAYMTGGDVPSPLPVPSFSGISGPALQFLGPVSAANVAAVPSGATALGAESVGAPTTPGQSVITISAANQAVNITADDYPALAINTAANNLYPGPTGLTCTSSGCAPTTSGTPDLSITYGTPSSFNAPGGIVEVAKTIDQISSADFVNATTSLPLSDVCNNVGIRSVIFKTASGVLVKLEMQEFGSGGAGTNPGVCAWTDVFGPYLASDASGNFAY